MMLSSAAAAQTVDGTSPGRIAQILQAEGYKALVTTDSEGDPKIDSGSHGVSWSIFFYGCTGSRNCRSVQFAAAFDMRDGISPEIINRFNRNKRYTRAYYDTEFDPFLEYDVNLDGGVSEANFADSLDIWNIILGDFIEEIGWE